MTTQRQLDFDVAVACLDCDDYELDLEQAARDGWQTIEPATPPCKTWFTHLGVCPECWSTSEYNPSN